MSTELSLYLTLITIKLAHDSKASWVTSKANQIITQNRVQTNTLFKTLLLIAEMGKEKKVRKKSLVRTMFTDVEPEERRKR